MRHTILPLVVACLLVAAPIATLPAGAGSGDPTALPTPDLASGPAAPTPVDDCGKIGTDKSDEIEGNERDNVICGLDGKDTLTGGPGDDVIYGGPGNDTIDGGNGDDTIYGGGGADIIIGDDEDDKLFGGPGKDDIKGSNGNDTMSGGIGEDTCRQNLGHGKTRECEWPNPFTACPVPGGYITDSFGADRGDHTHQGVDIMADKNEPIYSVIGGKAERGNNSLGGKTVDVTGAGGYTYNAHLNRFGDEGKVKAGDEIGTVGSTGNAQGGAPHLHFEWHPGGGNAVDPYDYLIKVCQKEKTPLIPVSDRALHPLD